jgi:malonyl-CoA decarboxylase
VTKVRHHGKVSDPVAAFHLSNGARVERINAFGNLRLYGLKASFGTTINYRYIPEELEENHERFVTGGQIRISDSLSREHEVVEKAWGQTQTIPSYQ